MNNDMNSDTDDDFDLMQIVHDREQVGDPEQFTEKVHLSNILQESMKRKKDLMRILIHHHKRNENYSMQKIQDYVDHVSQPLGPIFKSKKVLIPQEKINQEMFVYQQYFL